MEFADRKADEAHGRPTVLIADPALSPESVMVQKMIHDGFRVLFAQGIESAADHLLSAKISFCLTELRFDDGTAHDLLRMLAVHHPGCRTIVHSAYCDVPIAVALTRAGAADVLPKPMSADFVLTVLMEKDLRCASQIECLQGPNAVREEHIRQVLISCGANISRTAHRLSMHRRTLQRMLEKSDRLRALVR
jgi:two-component system response regulator RegA